MTIASHSPTRIAALTLVAARCGDVMGLLPENITRGVARDLHRAGLIRLVGLRACVTAEGRNALREAPPRPPAKTKEPADVLPRRDPPSPVGG